MMANMFPKGSITSWPLLGTFFNLTNINNKLSHTNLIKLKKGKLYLFNTVLITFSLGFSAFIINSSRGDHVKSVPDWLKRLTINILSKLFCIQAIAYSVFNAYNFK